MYAKMWNIQNKNIEKQGVIWNILSSGLNSVVSIFLLWVVTRVCGVIEAGIFSLGFSTSQMMLTIGNYGMRNFQVTDIKKKYSMRIYLSSRILTSLLMIFIVFGFVFLEEYNLQKALITILLCFLKVTDAFDDVYGGEYQKKGRLDISGKIMTIRISTYIIAFCISLIFLNNLILSCCIAIFVSTFFLIFLVRSTKSVFRIENPLLVGKEILHLLTECMPLCVSAFLLIFMGNAPKYAIDTYMTAEAQAYYTYLFMPCFVTNLFVGFALQPLLVRLSKAWMHREYKRFIKLCACIWGGTVLIAMSIMVGGDLIGCQVLSILFGVSLYEYKAVLIVLLLGGSFFAFSVIEQIILTVMRKQFWLLIGFGIASLTAMLISGPLVSKYGLIGAGYAYTVSAGVLLGVLGLMIVFFFYKRDPSFN